MKRFKLWVLSNPRATKEQLQYAKKIVHELTETLMNFCGNLYFKIFKQLTQWDKNRLAFLQAFIVSNYVSYYNKTISHLVRTQRNVKEASSKNLIEPIKILELGALIKKAYNSRINFLISCLCLKSRTHLKT